VGFLKNEVSRQFIAVPDESKQQIVYKWPDINIRKGARAIIEPDQVAVFVNPKREIAGVLPPGQHKLDADEIMFLGLLVDWATDDKAFRAEIFFVGTREYTGQTFGGRIDNVQDPQTGMIITLRVFGEYALEVADPQKLIMNLTGTVNVEDNRQITDWMSQQLLKVIRTEVTRQIVRNGWPILGLSAYTPEIEAAVLTAANAELAEYGIAIARMGNFDINLDEDDEETLKGFQKDTAYSRLAGSFGQYAAGSAMIGAGEGMSKGGAGTQGAFLAAGMGFGGQMAAPQAPGPTPPAAPAQGGPGYPTGPQSPDAGAAAGVACPACGNANVAGAKFCMHCGGGLPTAGPAFCTGCGGELVPGAKFCPGCGTPTAAGTPAPAPAPTGAPPAPAPAPAAPTPAPASAPPPAPPAAPPIEPATTADPVSPPPSPAEGSEPTPPGA
jgi:membrane protease subunit (stomatin/prohibitin family)